MQTLEMVKQFYAYNDWANYKFLSFLENWEKPDAKAVKVFAHLLLAEKTWLGRMLENLDTSGFNFWAGETVEDCARNFEENKLIFEEFFTSLTEEKLESVFNYKNSKGDSFRNTFREALSHVFLHSVYHRGQIAQAIRDSGENPPYTDFIQFLRQK
jgi:uncharacterized damage-inducible protein DinB